MQFKPGSSLAPAGHAETRFTLDDGTVETANITGTLYQQWFIDNGYYDTNVGVWSKDILQVDIGNTVTSIGDNAFVGGGAPKNVTIPDSVMSIGRWAFDGCKSLTSMTIPDSVTSIGDYAFSDCSGLTSVTIVATGKPGASAANVKQAMIAAGVSESITWNMPEPTGHADTWYKYAGDTEWRTVSISGEIAGSWMDAAATTQIPNVSDVVAIELGTDINTIGDLTFCNCQNLTSIVIPATVNYMNSNVFDGCTNLTDITLPFIPSGSLIFSNSGITTVTINGTKENVEIMYWQWGLSSGCVIHCTDDDIVVP